MRLVGLDHVNEDDVLARPIFDIDGRRLLNSGISLKPSIIQKLYEKGITSVYIDDELSEGIEAGSVLSDETRSRVKMIVRNEMNRLSQRKEIDHSALNSAVEGILDEMLAKKLDVLNVKDVRLQDEYVFAHSLNVCVLTIALATKLSLPPPKVKSIALGALMHDIGKALVSPDILRKNDPTPLEQQEIRKHPMLGYNIVKDIMDVSPTSKIAILMHHEQINGDGYPMGLSGDKIHYSARMVTICDAFDQAVNDRKYKNVYRTTDAVEYMIGASGHIFDKTFVNEFIRIIPVYPEGTLVLLSNGVFAIVVKNNPVNMTRPVVRVFYDPKKRLKYEKAVIINLENELSIKIIREISVNPREL
jgi:putative nucleotidyltransferase with HDIG domain